MSEAPGHDPEEFGVQPEDRTAGSREVDAQDAAEGPIHDFLPIRSADEALVAKWHHRVDTVGDIVSSSTPTPSTRGVIW